MKKGENFKKNKGIGLIDVLVGTALMLIIFLGVFGAYQLGLKTVGYVQNKIIATAIANQQIEIIKNLPYESVGVKGVFPEGVLDVATTTIRNGVQYSIIQRVDYVIDIADGLESPTDECPNDYKVVEVMVSWSGIFSGYIRLSTNISSKNLTQECAVVGGILSVSVFDAFGVMVSSPLIEVRDPNTDQVLKTATPVSGQHYFSLATSTYKVVVSKDGYSTERTYGASEVANPEKPHPIVIENKLTEKSFSIDKISVFEINTLSPWGTGSFSDSFSNESKISESSDLLLEGGEITLATSSEGYLSSGYLISTSTLPTNLSHWEQFSFSDSEPAGTDLKYKLYFASGTDWYLIPDGDLAGNSAGFDLSPVDLSELSTTTYSKLKLRGNFSSSDSSSTPVLYDWQISWITSESVPIPNAAFKLRGNKIIGTDAEENKIYKYSISTSTDSAGHKSLSNLEWDSYTFSIEPATGLDLVEIQPSSQPISLSPNTTSTINLFLDAQNSLLLTIENASTLVPVFAAEARLYNVVLSYDTTQFTNETGQTFFIPLGAASYNLEIEAPNYLATSTSVSVSGDTLKTIKLEESQ